MDPKSAPPKPAKGAAMFGQTVLVLQGGGALGAYQLGVYQAMHEAGVDPDWVVGTSIGAINGAIIAGNAPDRRLERLHEFWDRMAINTESSLFGIAALFGNSLTNFSTFLGGIPAFFAPNPSALLGQTAQVGIEKASYYTTEPLRKTLQELIDFDYLDSKATRLTVGAVNANSGEMRYFDSAKETIRADHIMASGALPPAFPAVRIDGEPYWDGGIYSNTPVEVVLDDNPRRDSTIFAVQLWNPAHREPRSLADITERQKDIQFSTRDNSHIQRQQQIHKLRHIIRQIGTRLPEDLKQAPEMKELTAWGCGTTMHLVRLHAPRIEGEDATKDIDFTAQGIRARWRAGYEDGKRAFAAAPWRTPGESTDGVVIHQIS